MCPARFRLDERLDRYLALMKGHLVATENKRKGQLLPGHKRLGKRFIPPLMQMNIAEHISYIDDILPELIWTGLLNERIGYVESAGVLERISLTVEDIRRPDQHGNFAIMSTFKTLNDEQNSSLVRRLEEEDVGNVLRNSVAPLTLLYEGFPLSFLGPPDQIYSTDELVSTIKKCVDRVVDKYETPGIMLNGALMFSLLVTKRLSICDEIDIPDFNSVVTAPESDEAKHAAAFLRANALAEFGMRKIDSTWSLLQNS